MNICLAYIDGCSRGNPGHAGVGILLLDGSRSVHKEIWEYIGEATNNQAEYKALLTLLKEVTSQPEYSSLKRITIHSDSELLVKQMRGEYKIRNKGLIKLHLEARKMLRGAKFKIEFVKIPREENKEADQLANLAVDQHNSS